MCTCPFYCLYRLDLLVISRRPCIVWTFHYHWSHWSGLLAFQRTYRPCQLSWTIFGQISSTACTASRGPYSETHSSPLGTVSSTPTFRWSLTPRPSGSLSRCPHSAIPWCAAPLTDGRPLLRQPETICERVAISCCWYARHALSYLFQTIWLWPSPGPRTRQRIRQCTKWWRRPVSRTRPPSTWLWVRWTSGSMRWSSSSCRAFSCRCSASYWCWPYVASVNAVNSCFVEPERKAAPEQKSSVSPSRRHARATTRRRCSSALSCYFLSPSFHKASLHWSLSVILDPEVHRAQSTGPCQWSLIQKFTVLRALVLVSHINLHFSSPVYSSWDPTLLFFLIFILYRFHRPVPFSCLKASLQWWADWNLSTFRLFTFLSATSWTLRPWSTTPSTLFSTAPWVVSSDKPSSNYLWSSPDFVTVCRIPSKSARVFVNTLVLFCHCCCQL